MLCWAEYSCLGHPASEGSDAAWSELYNVDRVARSDGLDQLPLDYLVPPPMLSAPAADVPQLGRPLPDDLGSPILKAEQQAQRYGSPGNDPAEAERLARLPCRSCRAVLKLQGGNYGAVLPL